MMKEPLAHYLRPKTLEEVIGQKHILGNGGLLNKVNASKNIPNMIFYGPPGVGKTTVANIIAENAGKRLYKLNATTDSLKDIKSILEDLDTFLGYNGVVVYIDEIHHFPKRTQQVLLESMENGQITLIGSTTENPYFYVFKALLSRSLVVEFKALNNEDIYIGLKQALDKLNKTSEEKIIIEEEAFKGLTNYSDGDLRRGLNLLEVLINTKESNVITLKDLEGIKGEKILNYDRDGDSHYDLLSAFQKSIRGSDPDAAIVYLAMLIKGGDLISICRRILVIAAEDIGLAYPQGITVTKSCVDAAMQLGFPEARIPLAEATILLATAPKSNSANAAIDMALNDLNSINPGEIPSYLRDGHYEGAKALGRMEGYKYPHSFKNHYVKQEYMPLGLQGKKYYDYGDNKMERNCKEYWSKVKNQDL